MPTTLTRGCAVVIGAHAPRPIVNVPANATKVRLRLRHDSIAMAFVKFADRIERWVLSPEGNDWKLGMLQGVNAIKGA